MFVATPFVRTGPTEREHLLGAHLDQPVTGRQLNAHAVPIEGWAVARRGTVRAVSVVSGDATLQTVPVSEDRPDVAAHFGLLPSALRSGFRTTVDAALTAGDGLEIRAVLDNGETDVIGWVDLTRSWRAGSHVAERDVVSIVIPCFRQAGFLPEAVESCLRQEYDRVEIVIVDDGSPDNAGEVARRYAGVRYVRQDNQGLAEARNTGIRVSNGEYLVFLDADDRLTPSALTAGVAALKAMPECAFASGEHCYIGLDGRRVGEWQRPVVTGNHYNALLRGNYIGCASAVVHRRAVFQAVGPFDRRWSPCEDYELYLRIARRYPVAAHDGLVAEYRRYGSSMSDNPGTMLEAALRVLRSQVAYARRDPERREALADGRRYWRDYYGPDLATSARAHLRTRGCFRRGVREGLTLARLAPSYVPRLLVQTPALTPKP